MGLPDSADSLVLVAGTTGTVLAHWTPGSRSKRTRVFQQIVGVDDMPVNVKTVSDPETTLSGLPSGKTVQVFLIAANDAGQAQAGVTVSIVVP